MVRQLTMAIVLVAVLIVMLQADVSVGRLLIHVLKVRFVLQLMEVLQIQMIVHAARLTAMHRLVSFVYNNRMPTCAQIKPLAWVILLVVLVVIGVTINQKQENILYHVEVHVL